SDNYRTTYVKPLATGTDANGNDKTDPGQPIDTTSIYQSMVNDQVDPPANTTGSPRYYCVFGSAHSAVCNFAFCDGHTTSVSINIDTLTHRYLGERNDGKILDDAVIGQ